MGIRIVLSDGESIGLALKRLRKLLERYGVAYEQRRRKQFVKAAQIRRAKRFRKRFNARQATLMAQRAGEQSPSPLANEFWRRSGKSRIG